MKYISHLFNAMMWALSISLFLFSNTTLQMAFNTGYVFWGGTILFFLLQLFIYRKEKRGIGLIGSAVSLFVCFLSCITFLGPQSLAVAPAALIRRASSGKAVRQIRRYPVPFYRRPSAYAVFAGSTVQNQLLDGAAAG